MVYSKKELFCKIEFFSLFLGNGSLVQLLHNLRVRCQYKGAIVGEVGMILVVGDYRYHSGYQILYSVVGVFNLLLPFLKKDWKLYGWVDGKGAQVSLEGLGQSDKLNCFFFFHTHGTNIIRNVKKSYRKANRRLLNISSRRGPLFACVLYPV